jgi:hypothetical protein
MHQDCRDLSFCLQPADDGIIFVRVIGSCHESVTPSGWHLISMCCCGVVMQESGLLNRPEIPRLSGLNKSLLVKAYDLGLIDVRGRTETRVVAEMLAAADAQVGSIRQ